MNGSMGRSDGRGATFFFWDLSVVVAVGWEGMSPLVEFIFTFRL